MNMKRLIQQMTNIESSEKQQLTESTLEECGEAAMPAPENPGNPGETQGMHIFSLL